MSALVTVLVNAGPWLPVPRTVRRIETVVATLVPPLRAAGVRVVLATVAPTTLPAEGYLRTTDEPQFDRIAAAGAGPRAGPAVFAGFLAQLGRRLDDSVDVDLQKRGWEARHWDPDDSRVDELAAAIADNLLTRRAELEARADLFSTPDATARYELVNHRRADEMPSMARMTTLIEERLRAAGLEVPHG